MCIILMIHSKAKTSHSNVTGKEMIFSLSIRSTFTLFITRLPQLDLMVLSTFGIRIASRDLRLLVGVLNPFLAVASIMMAQYLLMGSAMTGAVVLRTIILQMQRHPSISTVPRKLR